LCCGSAGDGVGVRGVGVVSGGECVPGCRLLVMDMWLEAVEGWRGGFGPRVRVRRLGRGDVWGVQMHGWRQGGGPGCGWQMRGVVVESARDVCGVTEGPCGHGETWWWSGEVAEAVGEGGMGYRGWRREGATEAGMECGRSGQDAKRVVSSVGEERRRECAGDLNDSGCRSGIFRVTGQMVEERRGVTGLGCVEGASGKVVVDDRGIGDSCRECMGRLVGGESGWDHGVSAEVEEGPADCIGVVGVGAVLGRMKGHGAPGLSCWWQKWCGPWGMLEHSGYWICVMVLWGREASQKIGGRVWCCRSAGVKATLWGVDFVEGSSCWNVLWKSWRRFLDTGFGGRLGLMACGLDSWGWRSY